MRKEDFDYELPAELIAQQPSAKRGGSRLLVVDEAGQAHRSFEDLPTLLDPGDLLVLNDTRVIKARLEGVKDSGGKAELLVERIESELEALCQVRVSKPLQPGRSVSVAGQPLEVVGRAGEFYRLRFPAPVLGFLDAHGAVPLPPYIERPAGPDDSTRYQTLWSRQPGAVAAPTAGLHFSEHLLAAIAGRGVETATVTLHVGAGTFQPVRDGDLARHRMHSERYEVPAATAAAIAAARDRGGRIVAVGTTVVRTLESVATGPGEVRAGAGETRLFITPGFQFRIVDALITNFHLPESTLLMLVCAFAGYEPVMAAYRAAVAASYRFFSYGDAMFLTRRTESPR